MGLPLKKVPAENLYCNSFTFTTECCHLHRSSHPEVLKDFTNWQKSTCTWVFHVPTSVKIFNQRLQHVCFLVNFLNVTFALESYFLPYHNHSINYFFTWKKSVVPFSWYIDFCAFGESTKFRVSGVSINIAGYLEG